jgi:hypothetical protein
MLVIKLVLFYIDNLIIKKNLFYFKIIKIKCILNILSIYYLAKKS